MLRPPASPGPDLSASRRSRAQTVIVLLGLGLLGSPLAGCGAAAPPSAVPAPRLPATGVTASGARFEVTLDPALEADGPTARLVGAWCPRVDLRAPGRRPTHGAVGCRPIRPHLPTGGYTIFCRAGEVFVLLLTTQATTAVSVEAAPRRMLALTRYGPLPGHELPGRFWLVHYPGSSSPRSVSWVEGAHRSQRRYPVVACLGSAGANGLLGR